MLGNIRVVLVDTSHPGNIGAAARAMKTMCLERLYLVTPKAYPSAEATARASGADDLLARAVICEDLDAALADCTLVIGASARPRSLPWPELDPRACAGRAVNESVHNPVAIVFGREHSGLTNEELERCNYLVHIPANPAYGSLNLAAAVQVICYELLLASGTGSRVARGVPDSPRADAGELERFYRHLEQALLAIGFLDPANPRHLMRRLRRLYTRVGLERNEVNILRGILTAVNVHKSRNDKP